MEAFSVEGGPRGSVHISTDDDLGIQFKRGAFASSNHQGADALMALCLGVDHESIDVLVCSGQEFIYEVLMRAQRAIEMALEGYGQHS